MESPSGPEDADVEQAPEGASEDARPDIEESYPALRKEGHQQESDPEEQDPESGPASRDE